MLTPIAIGVIVAAAVVGMVMGDKMGKEEEAQGSRAAIAACINQEGVPILGGYYGSQLIDCKFKP